MNTLLAAWFHRRMAILATLFGRPAVALSHWRAVSRLRPRDALAVATIGHLLAAEGRRDEAMAALEASLALDAGHAAVWFNLGFLQQERDEHGPALASFERALALDPKLDRAW